MPNYKVSIITPFNNTNMNLFRECFDSMIKQTIGFGNIEWIIVVHNCRPNFMPEIKSMCSTFPNIVLYELNNEVRSASSPRNQGMRLASAPYIGFLDADDSYTLDCLEQAYKVIVEEKAQIVRFRMEYELEDSSCSPLQDIVLWNQCEEKIVIEKGKWDYEKMFASWYGWVTARLFERKFLLDNDLFFDENITFVEDYNMLTKAMIKADKMVYLPQTIGYHYMINKASAVQRKNTAEELIRIAKDIAELLKKIKDAGGETEVSEKITLALVNKIIASKTLNEKQRKEIKDVLGEYVEEFKEYPANKLMTLEESNKLYRLNREVILNTEDTLNNVLVREMIDVYILYKQ